MSMLFPESVYHHRVLSRYSQTDLGDKVGVSRQTIASIEKGRTDPAFTIALKIAKVMGINLNEVELPPVPKVKKARRFPRKK
jgi:putative transcriptional regulator